MLRILCILFIRISAEPQTHLMISEAELDRCLPLVAGATTVL